MNLTIRFLKNGLLKKGKNKAEKKNYNLTNPLNPTNPRTKELFERSEHNPPQITRLPAGKGRDYFKHSTIK